MVGITAGLFNPRKNGHVQGSKKDTTPDFEIRKFADLLDVVRSYG
jgi:hypothetical protein